MGRGFMLQEDGNCIGAENAFLTQILLRFSIHIFYLHSAKRSVYCNKKY